MQKANDNIRQSKRHQEKHCTTAQQLRLQGLLHRGCHRGDIGEPKIKGTIMNRVLVCLAGFLRHIFFNRIAPDSDRYVPELPLGRHFTNQTNSADVTLLMY